MMTTTTIPLYFPFFFAFNLATLHHMRRHHHEQWEKSMEMGKTERGEKSQPFFGEERRGSTKTCPSFPSLLLFSSSPSPFSFLDLLTTKGGAGRGDGLVFRKGRWYCSAGGYCSMAPRLATFWSELQTRHVSSQTECTRRALCNHSVCSSIQAMEQKKIFLLSTLFILGVTFSPPQRNSFPNLASLTQEWGKEPWHKNNSGSSQACCL